jgi:hypothetical protein
VVSEGEIWCGVPGVIVDLLAEFEGKREERCFEGGWCGFEPLFGAACVGKRAFGV